ncbi:pantothenate kinase [Bradyrhizobium sp. LM2.7]
MTADERVALIWLKIERANKHVRDLNDAIVAFMAAKPYKVEVRRDIETRKPTYFIAEVKPVPQDITVLLGEAIQAFRTALDHLAYQLFLVGTAGSVGVGKHIYFPIARDATEYKSSSPRRVVGLRQDAIDKINTLLTAEGKEKISGCYTA